MNYKTIIKDLLPFGLLKTIVQNKYPVSRVIQYDPTLPDIPFSESKFKSIVSIQGFGFSGSGAVTDYLREFSTCLTLGTIDIDGSVAKGNRLINGEVDFLRYSGGLFEFEHYLDDNNLFTKDALVKRFIRLANSQELFKSIDARRLVNQFYNQLIEFEINTKGHNDYNSHIANPLYPDSDIKIMRHFSISQYRDLCRRFLTALFNLYADNETLFLVLDQLCNDINYDLERDFQYIPNLKTILVYRDPRDTYAYAIMKDVPWIPHDSVEHFIQWYLINKRKVKGDSDNFLTLRFEEFVLDYNKASQKVVSFLGLKKQDHTAPFSCFAPEVSAKNIAIWRQLEGQQEELALIHRELKDYCFEG